MYTATKIAHLQKLAESRGQSLQVSASGNQYLVKYCADEKSVRTDSGLVTLASIDGYSFVDTPNRTDSSDFTDTSAYDDMTLLGGFCGEPYRRTDFSDSDRARNDLSTAISGNTQQKRDFRERRDTAYLGNQKTDSNVVTLPPIQLSDSQKQQVKQMIEQGEDGRNITAQFGRIDQQDLKSICDQLNLDPLDRILRFLA